GSVCVGSRVGGRLTASNRGLPQEFAAASLGLAAGKHQPQHTGRRIELQVAPCRYNAVVIKRASNASILHRRVCAVYFVAGRLEMRVPTFSPRTARRMLPSCL